MKRKLIVVGYVAVTIVATLIVWPLVESELDSRDAADRLAHVYGIGYANAEESADESVADWDVMGAVAIVSPQPRHGMGAGLHFRDGSILRAEANWAILNESPQIPASWNVLPDEPPRFVFRDEMPLGSSFVEALPAKVIERLPVLYTTPSCVFCRPTKRSLDDAGVKYREVDASGSGMTVPSMDYLGRRYTGMNEVVGAFATRMDLGYVEPASVPMPMEMVAESHGHEMAGHQMGSEMHGNERRGPLKAIGRFLFRGRSNRPTYRSSHSAPMRRGGS